MDFVFIVNYFNILKWDFFNGMPGSLQKTFPVCVPWGGGEQHIPAGLPYPLPKIHA